MCEYHIAGDQGFKIRDETQWCLFALLHKFSAECVLPDDYGAGTLISINNVIQTGLSVLHSNNNVINWHFISYVLLALLHLAGKLLPIGTKTRF